MSGSRVCLTSQLTLPLSRCARVVGFSCGVWKGSLTDGFEGDYYSGEIKMYHQVGCSSGEHSAPPSTCRSRVGGILAAALSPPPPSLARLLDRRSWDRHARGDDHTMPAARALLATTTARQSIGGIEFWYYEDADGNPVEQGEGCYLPKVHLYNVSKATSRGGGCIPEVVPRNCPEPQPVVASEVAF